MAKTVDFKTTLSPAFFSAAIREAEACLGTDAGDLNEELYTEFSRSGNRVHYEGVNFCRRRLLNRLALGELCEGEGRFLPELTRIIACTLTEPSWVLPAHSGGRLPEGDEENIDLFSSQTAAALAMISARLPLAPALQKQIWQAIDTRIFLPFLTHDYWWRDLGQNRRKVPSNWTPWCIHGVLECVRAILPDALPWCDSGTVRQGVCCAAAQQTGTTAKTQLKGTSEQYGSTLPQPCFTDTPVRHDNVEVQAGSPAHSLPTGQPPSPLSAFLPQKRLPQLCAIAESCLASLNNYFSDYPDDGGCDEGAQYWEHSVGHFFECGLWQSFDAAKLARMYSFIYKVHLTGSYYVNFADCAARFAPNASMIFAMGCTGGLPELTKFGAYLHRRQKASSPDPTLRDNMDFRAVLNAALASDAIEHCTGEPAHKAQEQIGSLSVGIFRNEHFCVAVKGGHNGENHNHNDCGNVVVYADGSPLLIDVGVGEYTKDTFSDRRYTIWTMQSSYHNLPEINGYMQQDGAEFGVESTTFSENGFRCICGTAYPKSCGLLGYTRTGNVGEKFVKLTSKFTFQKAENHIALNYMCARKPELENGIARLSGCLIKLPKGDWSVGTVEFGKDEKLSPVWGHCVYRLRGEIDLCASPVRTENGTAAYTFTAVTIVERGASKYGAKKSGKMPGYTVITESGKQGENTLDNDSGKHVSRHQEPQSLSGKTTERSNPAPFFRELPEVSVLPSDITCLPAAAESDIRFMREALKLAEMAAAAGDVPIGCVIAHGEEIIAGACNMRNQNASVLAHAETLAIEEAAKKYRDFRLEDCTLYVTLEPCPMCAGAIVQARIPRVVIGTMNPKAGCAGSILNILQTPRFNHQCEVTAGVCREECAALLSGFFRKLRQTPESVPDD